MAVEERKRFQFFLNPSNKEEGVYTFYLQDDSVGVMGREVVLSNGMKVVYYFLPTKDNEAILLMCVGKDAEFETALEDMTEYDMKVFRRPWPNFITAIENSIHGRLHLPSLIAVDIHSKRSYFTSMLLSNIKLEEMDESEYILEKVRELMEFTTQMLAEMFENALTGWEKAKIIGTTFFRETIKVVRLIRVFTIVNP